MTDSINEQHMFAPHDVAGMFDVSVMTVRRWAEYHKEHLSESANPPTGEKRLFTWSDIEKFRQIKAWRDEGLSVEAINNRLSNAVTPALTPVITPDSLAAHPGAPGTAVVPLQALDAINAQNRRIEALEASSEANRQSQRDYVQGIAIGFIAAALFFLILLLLVVAYHR